MTLKVDFHGFIAEFGFAGSIAIYLARQAREWIGLGEYVTEPNRGVNVSHLFLALGARKVAEPDSDDLEDQELLFFSRDELLRALLNGEFKVITWAAVVVMGLNKLA